MKQKAKQLTWQDITLQQFQQLQEIEENRTDTTPEEIATQRMAVVFGEDVEQLTIPEYIAKTKQCEFLADEIPDVKVKGKYTINGRVYITMLNPFDMSMGQYIDFKAIQPHTAKYEDYLTILLIPENHKYNDGYDLNQAKADFLQLPIPDVVAIGNFFFRLMKKYQRLFRHYLKRMLKKKKLTPEQQRIMEQITEQTPLFMA